MLEINLIRWRSLQRRRHFLQLIIGVSTAVLLALLVVWLLYSSSEAELKYQSQSVQKNLDLITKIKLMPNNQRVTASELHTYQQQYKKIQNIILRHSKTHQLFEILDELLPEQVTLTELQYRGDKLWLKGISHSNNDLSDFLIQLSQLTEFQQPQINFSLQKHDKNQQKQTNKKFELQVLFLSDNASTRSNESGISHGITNSSQNISDKGPVK